MVSRRHLIRVAPLTVVGGCLGGAGDADTELPPVSQGAGETPQPTATPTPSEISATPSTPPSTSPPTTADEPATDATSTPPPTTTTSSPPTPAPTPTPAATATVRIRGGAFEPRRLAVESNTLVRWVNGDPDTHRIRSTRVDDSTPWDFSSPAFDRGERVQHVFRDSGAYAYFSPTWGRSTSCGLVHVGGVAFDGDLPCESGY